MKKGVTINLDKPRTLRYGMNALAKIEDITGKSILSLDLNKVGIKDLLAIVYGGLYSRKGRRFDRRILGHQCGGRENRRGTDRCIRRR